MAVIRQGIERELDHLHRRLPRRWWLSYAWLGAGLGTGLLLSQVPVVALLAGGMRCAQLGLGLAATVRTLRQVLEPGKSVDRADGRRNGHARRVLVHDKGKVKS